jgi:DNA-binding MarR family transcriptional regulator/GNAT superfamily N-acetyltransferase
MTLVDQVRSFNRFYTREIGLLTRHLPGGAFSLPEARVIYELAQGGEQTAADLVRGLRMDKAHVSRILARLRARGLVLSRRSPAHGRRLFLELTPEGAATFRGLDEAARAQTESILAPLAPEAQAELASAMQTIKRTLTPAPAEPVSLRGLRPGDLGWITHRQAVLYHEEYGWDWGYEGLVSAILGRFVEGFDPAREDAWVAERDGRILGSIFLMKGDDPATAKLRLLYVEREARGAGIGRRLVETCIARARALGYRRMTLWTNDILAAARRIYVAAGFRLVDEAPHHSFGHDLVGQSWALDLDEPPAAAQ